MTKPAIAAFLIDVLQLEQMWSEQEREKEMELQQQGKERERVYLEKLARLEVEKAAVMEHKPEQKFDINRARSFVTSFDENAVDIFFEMFEKVAARGKVAVVGSKCAYWEGSESSGSSGQLGWPCV